MKFFEKFKAQFLELDMLERMAYIFMCLGVFCLGTLLPIVLYSLF